MNGIYHLVICYIAIEHGHRNRGFTQLFTMVIFHSFLYVYQRINMLNCWVGWVGCTSKTVGRCWVGHPAARWPIWGIAASCTCALALGAWKSCSPLEMIHDALAIDSIDVPFGRVRHAGNRCQCSSVGFCHWVKVMGAAEGMLLNHMA